MASKVVAIVGSYRKGGVTEAAVEAVLAGARAHGAETSLIRLIDRPIEFCTNCRACTQAQGAERSRCTIDDGLEAMLTEIEAADALVVASPVNYWNVTAVTRRFLERLLGAAYWPWGQHSPAMRQKHPAKPAVLISSCAMPLGWMIPAFTGAPRALRLMAESLGGRVRHKLWIGMSSGKPNPGLRAAVEARARRMGAELATKAS